MAKSAAAAAAQVASLQTSVERQYPHLRPQVFPKQFHWLRDDVTALARNRVRVRQLLKQQVDLQCVLFCSAGEDDRER